jgi:hypothetical protein
MTDGQSENEQGVQRRFKGVETAKPCRRGNKFRACPNHGKKGVRDVHPTVRRERRCQYTLEPTAVM